MATAKRAKMPKGESPKKLSSLAKSLQKDSKTKASPSRVAAVTGKLRKAIEKTPKGWGSMDYFGSQYGKGVRSLKKKSK